MSNLKYKAFPISEGRAKGEVLISKDPINFYIVKPESGVLFEAGHNLEGESIADKILVFPSDKGSSVVQMDSLYQMNKHGNMPKGLIIEHASTVLVSAAIVMEIPLITDVDSEFYQKIKSGDKVLIDTEKECVEIIE
ncbi:aconitase X swivel domain-containing protein [Anaerococcus sp. ENR1011]|uniref:Aconitase X swivel domain-containing protein n=1 Tax=Anaerococcus groningensis TaxID=3115616 RepID=A0ABW9MZJ6_9FIRM